MLVTVTTVVIVVKRYGCSERNAYDSPCRAVARGSHLWSDTATALQADSRLSALLEMSASQVFCPMSSVFFTTECCLILHSSG